jgi:hypothetical protein
VTRTALAASLLLLFPLSASAAEGPDPKSVRVAVLRLRSWVATPEELASLSEDLKTAIGKEPGLSVVDVSPPLVEKGADDWRHADKLLDDGIAAYGDLRLPEAVENLREAVELCRATYREYADVLGPRRLREAYLYLGLAKLEQGDEADAQEWFRQAARMDPSFEPDPRSYPPAVREKYRDAKQGLTGAPYESSRDILEGMAEKVGADVVVTGGVTKGPGGQRMLEIVIDDRWKGRMLVESAQAGDTPDAASAALAAELPKITARIHDKGFDPPAVARMSAGGGYALRFSHEAEFHGSLGSSDYQWRRPLALSGFHIAFVPWSHRGISIPTDLAFYAPDSLSHGGFEGPGFPDHPSRTKSVQGRMIFFGSFGVAVTPTWNVGATAFSAGPGLVVNDTVLAFAKPSFAASTKDETGQAAFWIVPTLRTQFRRTVGRQGFVEVGFIGEYDRFARTLGLDEPDDWSIRSQAVGGVSF